MPFVPDILRYGGTERQLRMEHFVEALQKRNLPYAVIDGAWPERHARAMVAVEEVMAAPHQFRHST